MVGYDFAMAADSHVDGESKAVDFDDSFGEGLWGFLRQVVPDAAGDNPEFIFAREFFAIAGVVVRVWCAVGITFKGDRRYGDDWTCKELLFVLVVFWLALSQTEAPAIVVDDDGYVVWVVE